MDIEKFEQLARRPGRTQEELLNMLRNAQEKGKPEYGAVIKEILNEKFPGWDSSSYKRGGARPTVVRFFEEEKEFPSAKAGYLWLVEKFIHHNPRIFEEINWETVFVAKGVKRLYFGRSPEKVFFGSPHLAEDPNNYSRLTNGWYVNFNLNNDQKFEILCKLAAVSKLNFDEHWFWEVLP